MKFFFPRKPTGLARPRLGKYGSTYNPQSSQMKADKWWFQNEMRSRRARRLDDGAIVASLIYHHPIPPSWPQWRRKAAVGASFVSTPDIDNCLKYSLDAMNGVVYRDDKFISSIWADQIYSETPGVEIQLHMKEGETMEMYALTVQLVLTDGDVNLMVSKANKLGLAGRAIGRVKVKEDEEGKHYYFEVQTSESKSNHLLC